MTKKIIIIYRNGSGQYSIVMRMTLAFAQCGWEVVPINCMLMDSHMTNIQIKYHIEATTLFLVLGRGCLFAQTVKQIKIPTIIWMPSVITDNPLALKITKTFIPVFDKVYTAHPYEIPLYKKYGIEANTLFNSTNPEHFKPLNLKQDIDISFMGNLKYKNRIKMFDILKNRNINTGYTHYNYVEIINRTKINLNIELFDFGLSTRVFETLACGGFLLTYGAYPKEDQLFEDGKHLVYFNWDNLEEKIDYYLNHEEERKKIGEQGKQEVLNKHTYIHRVRQLEKENNISI